ncbi:MAG: tRNA lysidine(34) synthetase TilS, partial [Gordonibacter urolithinfaciens]
AGAPRGGYVANIQGDLAVSANKRGVRVEPMAAFRARRKRG